MTITRRSLIAFAATLALAGCAKHESSQEIAIRIGSIAPLTGPQSHLGKDNDNGVRLAADEINASGLVIGGSKAKIVILSEDDQADPKTATIVAQKLVDEGVNGVIGDLNSGTSIPASKIYSDAGIAEVSPSATAIAYTNQGYKTAFRVITNDRQQGHALAEFAARTLKAGSIAIIDDRTAYGQGLADEFEKNVKASGARIVAREYTSDHATDFTAILTSIKGKKPDLIFFGGMDAQAGPMMKQIRNLGMKPEFLGADGSRSPEFIRLAGESAEGAYASSPGLPLEKMPGGKAFIEKFEAKYGKIQLYSPYCYDATMALVDAMKKANSPDPKKYLPFLAQTNLTGVTGPIVFDSRGDIKEGAVTLYQVRNGNWVALH